MNSLKLLFNALAILALAAAGANAQSPTRNPAAHPAQSGPVPSPTPAPLPDAKPAATTVAIVNGEAITLADIEEQVKAAILNDPDPYLRAFYQDPVKAVPEARQRALDARINSLLIAAEAKKRGETVKQFVDAEINSRIEPPTEPEIRSAYDANRDQIGGADLEKVRPDIIRFLRDERAQALYAPLVNRLRLTNVVAKRADVNGPNLAPGTVLAVVGGRSITVDEINARMKAYVYKLAMRVYTAQQDALNRRINDLLLIAEAKKQNVRPEEIVRAEVTDKIKPPTEAEISKFYEENKARINGDLASALAQISEYLAQQQEARLEQALAERVRQGAPLKVLLKEPEAPIQQVSAGDGPARGDANAAVMIVEFTDFQCSACGAMYPVMEEVLKSYGNRVRFVIRNLPLSSLHPYAFKAAEAAKAAEGQGKFWEYIDRLFHNQNALDDASLKKYATEVGLDRKRFDAELDSGVHAAEIQRDIEDGETYGVEATPTIFINGLMLQELDADALRQAIERAFKGGKR